MRLPEAPVQILRDRLGIPHVRVRSVQDAFFAQGFVHAQDRLWQMDLDRRRASGRAAEILGAEHAVQDVFVRRLELEASARADLDALDADTRSVLDAYAAGVNAWIETCERLPVEFELLGITPGPWQAFHCGAVHKVRHVFMSMVDVKLWRARLLRRLGPQAAMDIGTVSGRVDRLIVPAGGSAEWHARPDELAPAAVASAEGSNSWAVHGSRTASGLPLVAGDPHRRLEVPNVYYQNRIACPDFDAIGLSMPGVPGMTHFGHNASVAWCITHAMTDNQDLYVERPSDVRHVRTETVRVRDGSDIRVGIARTDNGPVVIGSNVSLRWTATDRPDSTLRCVLPMLRASSADELEDSMRWWVDPCNSLTTADVHGTISYLHRGRAPIRPRYNGWGPVPGWTGEHAWTGDVPFNELPRLRNTSYIVTANNRVCGDGYPHYLGMDYSSSNRAARIAERLEALEAATAADMAAIHADRLSLTARTLAPLLGLDGWDGTMDPDRAEPAIYAVVRDELAGMLLGREPYARVVAELYGDEPDPTPARTRVRAAIPRLLGTLAPAAIEEAYGRAIARLEQVLGPDRTSWRWGRVHTTAIAHPVDRRFDPPSASCGGDIDTVQIATAELGLGVEHSSVARYVFDLADWDRSGWVVPLGSSGDPSSPHYTDQAQSWADVTLYPMTYTWDALEVASRQVLKPPR